MIWELFARKSAECLNLRNAFITISSLSNTLSGYWVYEAKYPHFLIVCNLKREEAVWSLLFSSYNPWWVLLVLLVGTYWVYEVKYLNFLIVLQFEKLNHKGVSADFCFRPQLPSRGWSDNNKFRIFQNTKFNLCIITIWSLFQQIMVR